MRLLAHEIRTEQLLFWRNREAAVFTFLLPIIFFLMFGAIYGDSVIDRRYKGAAFLEAGMIGYGVASVAFAGDTLFAVGCGTGRPWDRCPALRRIGPGTSEHEYHRARTI